LPVTCAMLSSSYENCACPSYLCCLIYMQLLCLLAVAFDLSVQTVYRDVDESVLLHL
jgi:hypothetical protein